MSGKKKYSNELKYAIVNEYLSGHSGGYEQKAYEYFMSTARMDLDDHKGNTKNGVHTANMGGTWMCIVIWWRKLHHGVKKMHDETFA